MNLFLVVNSNAISDHLVIQGGTIVYQLIPLDGQSCEVECVPNSEMAGALITGSMNTPTSVYQYAKKVAELAKMRGE
jgi:hypothetical protein